MPQIPKYTRSRYICRKVCGRVRRSAAETIVRQLLAWNDHLDSRSPYSRSKIAFVPMSQAPRRDEPGGWPSSLCLTTRRGRRTRAEMQWFTTYGSWWGRWWRYRLRRSWGRKQAISHSWRRWSRCCPTHSCSAGGARCLSCINIMPGPMLCWARSSPRRTQLRLLVSVFWHWMSAFGSS